MTLKNRQEFITKRMRLWSAYLRTLFSAQQHGFHDSSHNARDPPAPIHSTHAINEVPEFNLYAITVGSVPEDDWHLSQLTLMEALARVLDRVKLAAVHLRKKRCYFSSSMKCPGETQHRSSDREHNGWYDLLDLDRGKQNVSQTTSSLCFSSDFATGAHARASVDVPLPPLSFSHARGHFRFSSVSLARRTKKKRETVRSLNMSRRHVLSQY